MVRLPVPFVDVPKIDEADLSLENSLGAGTYGAVYKAKWKSTNFTVAAKKVFVLEKEAEILAQCRHKNIIQFFGTCNMKLGYWIITEFAEKGSLADYLLDPSNPELSFEDICRWAVDIAQGMHYLHYEAVVTIVHRDLKSKNIVISSDNTCKLCDFGTCKTILDTSTSMSAAGTAAWMSPEMISGKATSPSTDIWSFGVVLWELVTGQIPFEGLNFFQVGMLVSEGNRLVIPSTCPPVLATLINDCWIFDAPKRPCSLKVLNRVRGLGSIASVSEDMKTFLSSKAQWVKEIEIQRKQLKKRELDLATREAAEARCRQKHRPHAFDRCKAPSDINDWDELVVVQWLYSIPLDVNKDALDHLANLIHDHHINGERLLMMTERDMKHMGITSLGLRKRFMEIIAHEKRDNIKQIEFPPLGSSEDMHRSVSVPEQPLVEQVIQATLLFGYYSYEDDARILWWKVFLDSLQNDQVAGLVKEVRFLLPSIKNHEPMKTRGFGQLPLACEQYQNIDLKQLNVECIVYFTDAVIKPRNTRIAREITHPTLAIINRRVSLTIRKESKRNKNMSPAHSASPNLQGDWRSPLSNGPPLIPSPTVPFTPSSSAFSEAAASIFYRKASAPTPSPEVRYNSHKTRAVSGNPTRQPGVVFSLHDETSTFDEDARARSQSMSSKGSADQCDTSCTTPKSKRHSPQKAAHNLTPLRLRAPVRSESDSTLSSKFSAIAFERKEAVPPTPPPLPQPFIPEPLATVHEGKKERLYEMKPKKGKRRSRPRKESFSDSGDGSSKFSASVHGGYQKLMWNH